MMIIVGGTGLGGALGCAAASLLPGFELASALMGTFGAMAGTGRSIGLHLSAGELVGVGLQAQCPPLRAAAPARLGRLASLAFASAPHPCSSDTSVC